MTPPCRTGSWSKSCAICRAWWSGTMPKHKKHNSQPDLALEAFSEGYGTVSGHPILAPLAYRSNILRVQSETNLCPTDGWAIVTTNGDIHVHPSRRAEADEWAYVLGHCLLHLAFGHFQQRTHQA